MSETTQQQASGAESPTTSQWIVRGGVLIVLLSVLFVSATGVSLAVEPGHTTTLQSDPGFLCDADGNKTFLGSVIDGLLSFVTVAAVPVFILLYQLDGLIEFFALNADTKAKIKKHQRNMWIGAAKIFLTGPIIKALAGVLNISLVSCFPLIPFA